MLLMLNGIGGSARVDKTFIVVHLLIGITLLKCVAGSVGPVNLACAIRFAKTGSYHSIRGSLVLMGSGHHARSGRCYRLRGQKPREWRD